MRARNDDEGERRDDEKLAACTAVYEVHTCSVYAFYTYIGTYHDWYNNSG